MFLGKMNYDFYSYKDNRLTLDTTQNRFDKLIHVEQQRQTVSLAKLTLYDTVLN